MQDLSWYEFPVIVKPTDSAGSKGASRVDNVAQLPAALDYAFSHSISKHVIVEEFIEGDEFGAQAFVQDGVVEFILPHGDYVFHGDTGVPIGHYAPFDVSPEMIDAIRAELEKVS